jgi:type VI secretion system protein ImpM
MTEFGVPGFFGKLPSRGDFVTRRLPREFIDAWDGWIQEALAASQARLGAQWLEVYLTSPVWCFVLSAGTCGESAYTGVLIPSVDKVGRYFPLIAAMPCAGAVSTLTVRRELAAWYERAQGLLLETLEEPALDLDVFDERLASLIVAPNAIALDWAAPALRGDDHTAWHFLVPEGSTGDPLNAAVLSELLKRDLGAHSIWWTTGSERVAPSSLIVSRLPAASAFAAMLDGDFSGSEWASGVLHRVAGEDELVRFQSAAASDPGKVRAINEDSFARRDDLGVWLVADGLGGHQAGDIASGMVACVPERLTAASTLEAAVEQLAQNLRVVNGCLRALAERNADIAMAASTVAALVAKGSRIAAVWAGDSRVYRFRDGRVEQLTRDHADGDDPPAAALAEEAVNRAVTRAVGGAPELELDIVYDEARPLDRYLLCTDGLYTSVSLEDLERALSFDAEEAGAELTRVALEGAATDNLTSVVVQVVRPEPEVAASGVSSDDR